jgi:competence protein ComEA
VIERWSGAPAPLPGAPSATSPLERHRRPLTAFFALMAVIGAALWLARQPVAPPITIPTPAAGPRLLKVHVAGAVAQPGLYQLADGARVADALAAAGGALPNGDAARLNLALRLRDGQQLVVPATVPPAAPAAAKPAPTGRVNLNTATQAELESLPGVGAVTARKILDHRQASGPFQSAEELRDARLVTNATWTRLAELVDAP